MADRSGLNAHLPSMVKSIELSRDCDTYQFFFCILPERYARERYARERPKQTRVDSRGSQNFPPNMLAPKERDLTLTSS